MDLGNLKVSVDPLDHITAHIETTTLYVERHICWYLNPELSIPQKTVHYISTVYKLPWEVLQAS